MALPDGHSLAGRDTVSLADLAGEPVICPDVSVSAESERHWIADPRPDGTPAPRGPAVAQIEGCLLMVARGRGIWPAPEPLSRWAPAPGVRWLPLTGAEPYELAVVWTPRAPESLVARLVAEIRKIIA